METEVILWGVKISLQPGDERRGHWIQKNLLKDWNQKRESYFTKGAWDLIFPVRAFVGLQWAPNALFNRVFKNSTSSFPIYLPFHSQNVCFFFGLYCAKLCFGMRERNNDPQIDTITFQSKGTSWSLWNQIPEHHKKPE